MRAVPRSFARSRTRIATACRSIDRGERIDASAAARRAIGELAVVGLDARVWSVFGWRVLGVGRWNRPVARSTEQRRIWRNKRDEHDSVQRGILGRMG